MPIIVMEEDAERISENLMVFKERVMEYANLKLKKWKEKRKKEIKNKC